MFYHLDLNREQGSLLQVFDLFSVGAALSRENGVDTNTLKRDKLEDLYALNLGEAHTQCRSSQTRCKNSFVMVVIS